MDAKCRRLTASWVRERAATAAAAGGGDAPDIELCTFFEEHERAGAEAVLPPGGPRGGDGGLEVVAARGRGS